jgi:hypothetical protein
VPLTFRAAKDAALGSFSVQVKGRTQSSSADFKQVLEITIAQMGETASKTEARLE